MLAALMLFAALESSPGISGPYQANFAAFDAVGSYLYTRKAWIFLGPAEKADGYPEPPAVEVRDIQIDIKLITTSEGERCSLTPSATIQEYGGNFFFGCRP
jgi:hypothetical protein